MHSRFWGQMPWTIYHLVSNCSIKIFYCCHCCWEKLFFNLQCLWEIFLWRYSCYGTHNCKRLEILSVFSGKYQTIPKSGVLVDCSKYWCLVWLPLPPPPHPPPQQRYRLHYFSFIHFIMLFCFLGGVFRNDRRCWIPPCDLWELKLWNCSHSLRL